MPRDSSKKTQKQSLSKPAAAAASWNIVYAKDFDPHFGEGGNQTSSHYAQQRLKELLNTFHSGDVSPEAAVTKCGFKWHCDRINFCRFNISPRDPQKLPDDLIARVIEITHNFPLTIIYSHKLKTVLFVTAWKSTHEFDSRYHPSIGVWTKELNRA